MPARKAAEKKNARVHETDREDCERVRKGDRRIERHSAANDVRVSVRLSEREHAREYLSGSHHGPAVTGDPRSRNDKERRETVRALAGRAA